MSPRIFRRPLAAVRRAAEHPLARSACRRLARLRERTSLRTLSWLGSALALVFLALPARAQSTGFFGQIVTSLQEASDEWVVFLLGADPPGAALGIFGLCLILQVAYVGYRTLLGAIGQTPFPLGQAVARQLLILIFLALTLWFWPRMGVAPMTLFIGLGKSATGLENGIEPDVLAATAFGLLQIFLSPKLFLFNTTVVMGPFTLLYIVFVVATLASMLAIALRALMLTVEGHLLAVLGPIPFAFSGFRLTAGLADNYIRYAAKFGIEYMLLLFFVDLGAGFAATWAAELEQISAFQQDEIFVFVLRITATSLAWALLSIRLPMKVASEFIHLWTPGIAEGLK
ncbi:MAG: type IV secretion system protein [bacterium]|nr:type IV secretion system protein [bacterium]